MQLHSPAGDNCKVNAHATDDSPMKRLDSREEVELPKLKEKLRLLNREVQEAKKKVLETIDSKQEEFVAAFGQIDTLRETVSQLQDDIRRASTVTGDSQNSAEDAPPAAARLQQAVHEHAALDTDLNAYEAVAVVLSSLLTAHRQLDEIAKLTSSARFADAAALCGEARKCLEAISAPEGSEEPAMLKRAKAVYSQRRSALVHQLEEAFRQLCAFGDGCAIVRPRGMGATLQEVWNALELLGLREKRAEQLGDQVRQVLLRPLFEAARRLPDGRQLQPRASTEDGGVEVWSWIEGNCDDSLQGDGWQDDDFFATEEVDTRKKQRSVRVILFVLSSLFDFVSAHWIADASVVCSTLGKKLWPVLVRHLMQHFQCTGDDGEALEEFEASMRAKGFIAAKETTLSHYVRAQRLADGKQRRIQVLQEAREWLMQDEIALTQVSESTEKSSITQILKQMGVRARRAQAQGGSSSSTQKAEVPISEQLQKTLKEDESLRLPSMHVSSSTHRLVMQIRSLMEELARHLEEGNVEAATDVNRLIRELSALFAMLRPFAQHARIAVNPKYCGIFFTDCLYLVHVLLVMPYSFISRVPQSSQHLLFFTDFVPQLRRLGEKYIASMLRHQEDVLVATFKRFEFSSRNFVGAETALMEAVQQVKGAIEALSESLPAHALKDNATLLVGMTCRDLLRKVFDLQHADPETIGIIAQLLTYVLMMLRPVLASAGAADDAAECVARWQAIEVVADLLGSDFSRFLQHRPALLQSLSSHEVLRLLELSLREGDLSPQEAWDYLSSS